MLNQRTQIQESPQAGINNGALCQEHGQARPGTFLPWRVIAASASELRPSSASELSSSFLSKSPRTHSTVIVFCKRIAGDENLNRQLILLGRFFSNHSPHSRTNRIADSPLSKSNVELSQQSNGAAFIKTRDKHMSTSGSAFGELGEHFKSELLSCFRFFFLN